MKKIEAIVQPFRLDAVKEALAREGNRVSTTGGTAIGIGAGAFSNYQQWDQKPTMNTSLTWGSRLSRALAAAAIGRISLERSITLAPAAWPFIQLAPGIPASDSSNKISWRPRNRRSVCRACRDSSAGRGTIRRASCSGAPPSRPRPQAMPTRSRALSRFWPTRRPTIRTPKDRCWR